MPTLVFEEAFLSIRPWVSTARKCLKSLSAFRKHTAKSSQQSVIHYNDTWKAEIFIFILFLNSGWRCANQLLFLLRALESNMALSSVDFLGMKARGKSEGFNDAVLIFCLTDRNQLWRYCAWASSAWEGEGSRRLGSRSLSAVES